MVMMMVDTHSTPTYYCCQCTGAKPGVDDGNDDGGHEDDEDDDRDDNVCGAPSWTPIRPQPTTVARVPGPSQVCMVVMMMILAMYDSGEE